MVRWWVNDEFGMICKEENGSLTKVLSCNLCGRIEEIHKNFSYVLGTTGKQIQSITASVTLSTLLLPHGKPTNAPNRQKHNNVIIRQFLLLLNFYYHHCCFCCCCWEPPQILSRSCLWGLSRIARYCRQITGLMMHENSQGDQRAWWQQG